MQDIVDLLQIKIEKAKRELPPEIQNAIAAIDWREVILGMRDKYGYTFEQLGDLELSTELVLCGLLNPADYPKEIEKGMGISKTAVNELVNEMNEKVFSKIKEELIKNTERKKMFVKKTAEEENDTQILNSAGIEIIEKKESYTTPPLETNQPKTTLPIIDSTASMIPPKDVEKTHPILAQKILGSFQIPTVKTEHSLNNLSKTNPPNPVEIKTKIPNIDPYREKPE